MRNFLIKNCEMSRVVIQQQQQKHLRGHEKEALLAKIWLIFVAYKRKLTSSTSLVALGYH